MHAKSKLTKLSFEHARTCARAEQGNLFHGLTRARSVITYNCFGAAADFAGLRKAFSVEEYSSVCIFSVELQQIMVDAVCAVEGRHVSEVIFLDISGISLAAVLEHMECECLLV